MKKLSLIFALWLGCCLLLSGCDKSTDWQHFTTSNDVLSVEVPGKPNKTGMDKVVPAGTEAYSVHAHGDDYFFSAMELPEQVVKSTSADQILAQAKRGGMTNAKAKIIKEQAVEVDGFKGVYLVFRSEDGKETAFTKICVAGNYLIVAVASTPETLDSPPDDIRRFLKSMSISVKP